MLVQVGLSNVLVAAVLALVAVIVGRVARRPALTHALWLLVLVKLITPPLLLVPVPWPDLANGGDDLGGDETRLAAGPLRNVPDPDLWQGARLAEADVAVGDGAFLQ